MQQENDQRLQSRASLSRERAELQTQRRDFIHETGISHLMLFLPLGVQLSNRQQVWQPKQNLERDDSGRLGSSFPTRREVYRGYIERSI